MKTARLFLHTKDVMILTGYAERTARNLVRTIKDAMGKTQKQQLLTIDEFCKYQMIDKQTVLDAL